MSRTVHLKIKLKTLAAEARIIRTEERRALAACRHHSPGEARARARLAYASLKDHRLGTVAPVTRRNALAYGFLRGRTYAELEPRTRTPIDLRAVHKIAQRFGTPAALARWPAWQAAAEAHLEHQAPEVS